MIIKGPVSIEAEVSITAQRPVWVLSHPHPVYGGTMTHKIIDQLYRRAVDQGRSVLRYNFRGVGQSAGVYDRGVGEIEDLRLVIAYLKNKYDLDDQDIHLIGYSFGSYISCMVANEMDDLRQLSLIAPPIDLVDFPLLTTSFPVHMYMPEADEYTDTVDAKLYLDQIQAPKKYIEIEGANHFFVGTTKKFIDAFLSHNTLP